jgi:phosphoribosylformylglycinamidine synthase
VPPGSDAAVFLVREANKFLAATTDCNGIYCKLDPREGAKIAVAEAARNLACSGAVPLATTDNLNFGNPHKPAIFLQLREAVEGMAEACRVFDAPVTGGNVSLYNESPAGAVDPTPVVGMVGLIAAPEHITTQEFKEPGHVIILLGPLLDPNCPSSGLGGSHYLKVLHGRKEGTPPPINLEHELLLHNTLRGLITSGLVRSAHDCSEGGLAVAVAESCLGLTPLGARVTLPADLAPASLRGDVALFNESQARIVISTPEADLPRVLEQARAAGISAKPLGTVTAEPTLAINLAATSAAWSWDLSTLAEARQSISRLMA